MAPTETLAICRDCLAQLAGDTVRCQQCGGPRVIRHPELASLSIAHLDCDAFYAAIEKRDDPSLSDRPVIVGGGRRGVVATACYVARTYGVRSAMPMFKALKACPHAVVIRPDMAKYAAVGRQIRALMMTLTPAVEPISIDEAFLDLTGTERLHGAVPAVTLMRLQSRVEAEIGISVSIGLSHNKFLAKVASDLDKPRGFAVIGRAETRSFLAEKPVSLIWGVGKAMQEKLARDGLRTIGALQQADEHRLVLRYGSMGLRLARLSRGEDERVISPDREAKSISAETTFAHDLRTTEDLLPRLRSLAEEVSARLKAQHLAGQVVVLKLKTTEFKTAHAQSKLKQATNLADRIHQVGRRIAAG
jgi:DNA polymerase-4